ncbi:MAG: flagellar motor protein MotB [Bacteroidales bacterium]|nr:flagellar motor protein MotB [Bacteroidales bacterium]
MKSKNCVMIAFSVALMVAGCASKKDLVALQDDYANLQARYQETQIALAQCDTRSKSLDERLAEAQQLNTRQRQEYNDLKRSLDNSIAQNTAGNVNISKLVDEINASNQYIKQLVSAKSKSDSLNMILTNNLTRSLTRDELRDVDVQVLKGVVYISLSDNMLYRSGSYEINSRAAETLGKIAKIITDYKEYEVLVEGNTDNVPISKPNIRNNWDLSCLRASSVVQELQNKYGVDPKRLSAAGRGEYNPVQDNDNEVGRQRNRRTQIIVTPQLDQFLELIDQAPAEATTPDSVPAAAQPAVTPADDGTVPVSAVMGN